jgi:hypothetical protein
MAKVLKVPISVVALEKSIGSLRVRNAAAYACKGKRKQRRPHHMSRTVKVWFGEGLCQASGLTGYAKKIEMASAEHRHLHRPGHSVEICGDVERDQHLRPIVPIYRFGPGDNWKFASCFYLVSDEEFQPKSDN